MSKDRAYPIDFVLPWVDGSDPAWRVKKAKFEKEESSSVHVFDYQLLNIQIIFRRNIFRRSVRIPSN